MPKKVRRARKGVTRTCRCGFRKGRTCRKVRKDGSCPPRRRRRARRARRS